MSLDITPQRQTSHEISAQATASLARATIEAKFAMAHHRRRSVLEARASILDACKRPAFADGAWYKIPNRGEGFTIRFAEQALNAWRNVDVQAVTGWENESQRLIRVTVTDLESNLSFADEVLISKTVERSTLKPDQVPISVRENTDGKKVYLLAATEDEMSVKVNAAKSKVIRNAGLRLIPQDILEEAEEAIKRTKSGGGGDVMGNVKKVTDAFHGVGVSPANLESYLGHPLAQCNPSELASLRSIFAAIRDGDARWSDYVQESPAPQPQAEQAQTPRQADNPPPAQPASLPSIHGAMSEWMTAAGITFDELRAWGEQTGNIPDASSLGSVEDISPTVVKRLMRDKAGMANQIAAMRTGGAK